jgi:hypothetical protein
MIGDVPGSGLPAERPAHPRERRTLEVRRRAAAVTGWLRARRWSRLLAAAPLLAGALGGALAIGLLARQDARIGPLTVRLAAWPSMHAGSTLAVPPFGTVTADTHDGLLAVRATLDNVDARALARLIRRHTRPTTPDELAMALAPLEHQAMVVTAEFLLRLLAVGVLGGAAAALVLPRAASSEPDGACSAGCSPDLPCWCPRWSPSTLARSRRPSSPARWSTPPP